MFVCCVVDNAEPRGCLAGKMLFVHKRRAVLMMALLAAGFGAFACCLLLQLLSMRAASSCSPPSQPLAAHNSHQLLRCTSAGPAHGVHGAVAIHCPPTPLPHLPTCLNPPTPIYPPSCLPAGVLRHPEPLPSAHHSIRLRRVASQPLLLPLPLLLPELLLLLRLKLYYQRCCGAHVVGLLLRAEPCHCATHRELLAFVKSCVGPPALRPTRLAASTHPPTASCPHPLLAS